MSFSNIMDSNSYTADGDDDPLIAARERVLGPANRLFYDRPVHLVRGEGSHVFDADGVRYLDAYNNVASVGHCHPHVVDAVMQQMSTLNTHTRYLHRGIVDYSERLLATMPEEIDQVMYACTGSEVNDLALRVAEMRTGRNGCHRHPRRLSRQHRCRHGHLAVPRRMRRRSARTCGRSPPPDSYRSARAAARFAADVARRCRRPFAEAASA